METLESKENSPFESFTVGAIEASEILGVNRTRLSQLTSKGVFAYERRKVENHNRLFYRLNDLLNYQRNSTYGNLNSNFAFTERPNQWGRPKEMPKLLPAHEEIPRDEQKVMSSITNVSKIQPFEKKKSAPSARKISAHEVHRSENLSQQIQNLELCIADLKNQLLRQEEFLKKMELHLKAQDVVLHAAKKQNVPIPSRLKQEKVNHPTLQTHKKKLPGYRKPCPKFKSAFKT